MASERTAAAVPEESSVSDGRSSVAGATRSAVRSAVSAIDSLRDRLVNATDPVPDLASDPADDAHLDGTGSDTRGLVLRPALLGFVAILAVAARATLLHEVAAVFGGVRSHAEAPRGFQRLSKEGSRKAPRGSQRRFRTCEPLVVS